MQGPARMIVVARRKTACLGRNGFRLSAVSEHGPELLASNRCVLLLRRLHVRSCSSLCCYLTIASHLYLHPPSEAGSH